MEKVMAVVNYILALGPSIMMPIVILILCLLFGIRIGKALRAALVIGVGFIAIFLVIGLMVNTLSPATKAMVENLGVKLDVMDVGWPVAAAVAFGTTLVVPWVFVLGIALNVLLIALNVTRTLDIDMWNYWHFIFGAAFVYVITGNFALAIGIALITEFLILKFADWTAPIVNDFLELPGVSLPHTDTVGWAPLGWLLNRAIDRLPRLNRLRADPGTIQERWGLLGESMVVGTVLGGIIGLLGYGPSLATDPGGSIQKILNTAISMGAVMLVLPRMVRILMEGLLPLSEGAREFLARRFPGKQLYIGLDAAVAIGHPANIATGLLLVPITLLLGVLLSLVGVNRMLPFTDLAVLPFFAIWAVGWSRGNIVRGVLVGSVFMFCILVIATYLAPMTTQLAVQAKFDIPKGALEISSLDVGAHLTSWLLVLPFMWRSLFEHGTAFAVAALGVAALALVSYVTFIVYVVRHKSAA